MATVTTMDHPTRLKGPSDSRQRPVVDAIPKDDVELRLEKALFGDDLGFLDSLKKRVSDEDHALIRHMSQDSEASGNEEDEGLSDIPDENLFFVDTNTSTLPASVTRELESTSTFKHDSETKAAWYDSDDDRITVSLASNTRLRKLRDTEADDLVSGREYIARLRRQYEILHPAPEWVKYARKRRRISHDAQEREDDSDTSMSEDDNDSLGSAKPLAELLRTTGPLTRIDTSSKDATSRRVLRPEVIDIQRTKDIASTGPSSIDTLQFHPYYPLLLAAGPSSTVTIYHVSPHPPNPNPILTSLHLKGAPVHTAEFCRPAASPSETDPLHDQTRIFFSSRRRYFHTWSLTTGSIQKITRAMYGTARHSQRTMEQFKLSPDGLYMGLISSAKKGGGAINVLDSSTMQWICSCRIDSRGGIADFAWWGDSKGFAVVGKNGEVTEYDVETRSVARKWIDEGAVGTTVIALGGDMGSLSRSRDDDKTFTGGGSRWVAVGSSSGIVNLYDRRAWIEEETLSSNTKHNRVSILPSKSSSAPSLPTASGQYRPKPLRSLDQLTTPISHLEFSADGQMLVMSSRWKKNALRLVHLPSATVYRNWPTDKTPLGRISSLALSVDGGYLAVGNEQGKIHLWEIRA
ncbi:hypothetical protein B0A52_04816 [Exophiala mesophila]|uniref:Uncharacterized protein n=1 Tax=Exophiala mesophila TaxID=212818 RepID=A0A438N6J3_EXOME|nr:hypothetical protein B0A52_04816 [Exophiala mesophila]